MLKLYQAKEGESGYGTICCCGKMDKVNSPKRQDNGNRIKTIIQISVLAILLIVIFGANFSSKPLKITNEYTRQNYDTNEMQFSFTINNKTLGLILDVYYTIGIQDESGKTIYSDTVKASKVLLPFSKVDIETSAPYDKQSAKWSIGMHCRLFKPHA